VIPIIAKAHVDGSGEADVPFAVRLILSKNASVKEPV